MVIKDKTLLVVEDNISLSKIIKIKLRESGIKSVFASTGEEALDEIKKNKPDLIWLDIYMPGINGLEVLQKIRSNPDTADIDIVIVSVSGNNKKIEFANELGILEYFIKSNYSIDELVKSVKKIMEKDEK